MQLDIRFAFALVAVSVGGCLPGTSTSNPDEAVGVTTESIINGGVITRGSAAVLGVVNLNGCTGTLLTNRIVLTAHHCVRSYSDCLDDGLVSVLLRG
jgi:hypothetical protein